MIKRLSFLFFIAAAVASCTIKFTEQDFIGSWVEPIPGMEGVQGIRMEENGKARSIRMATLVYEHWRLEYKTLILSGKSIGNGRTLPFTDTLDIVKVDKDSLILSRGTLRIAYHRQGNNETDDIPEKIVRGTITFAPEVRVFQPQDDTTRYWLADKSGYLQKMYLESGKAEWKAEAELSVRNTGKSDEGFATAYDSVYQVLRIIEIAGPEN